MTGDSLAEARDQYSERHQRKVVSERKMAQMYRELKQEGQANRQSQRMNECERVVNQCESVKR